MSLSPAFLDELRARTSLSALIGKSVKLQKAGREWKACCPFHNEKSPSFYVNDDKGFYHCFGCSAHGDAIRWMTDQRGLPFIDAVKELALAAGMEMPAMDPRGAERAAAQAGLHDVTERAARWFAEQLHGLDGAEARSLLERRGVKAETARAFGLGFAPDSRTRLKAALKDVGDEKLVETGLLIQVDDKEPYDRFRGRLMIPIRDVRGRAIAFGGRIIGDGEPKYLNSPDTPLFDKGRTLFNLDRAAGPARKAGRIIVVEGYMDVIALAQAGVEEVVAPLGTALTEAQLERLWRIADVPLICLDGDSAGQKAALRAAHRALPMLAPGRSLAFVILPKGQDPDDLVRTSGRAAFEALAKRAEPLVDLLWASEHAAEPLTTPEARAGLKRRLGELARGIGDAGVREEYLAEFQRRFAALFAGPAQRPFQREPWKKGQQRSLFRPDLAPVTAQARTSAATPMDAILVKGVLAGLIRNPEEISRHAETLAALKLSDGPLARLLDAVIDVALHDRALDSDALVTILATSGFNEVASELLRADSLPFSFTSKASDPERAREDLHEAIGVMATRPALDQALAQATARMETAFDEQAFAEQQRLRALRAELDERLANLMQADKDEL
ncbi:DNA primase [Sphingomonas gilva]|uniref:DNA primase n=1 Tax=Sphingomonas gilva TaxID=2305907 RepID=A0A396RLR9_9SPHN|nr:DNA primase [Sphingomonas gilva]RHW17290.1 DNA primase [Sphingomonas gilva]